MTNKIEFTKRDLDTMVRRYKEKGWSADEIADDKGVSSATVLRRLRERRVRIKSRGRYPKAR